MCCTGDLLSKKKNLTLWRHMELTFKVRFHQQAKQLMYYPSFISTWGKAFGTLAWFWNNQQNVQPIKAFQKFLNATERRPLINNVNSSRSVSQFQESSCYCKSLQVRLEYIMQSPFCRSLGNKFIHGIASHFEWVSENSNNLSTKEEQLGRRPWNSEWGNNLIMGKFSWGIRPLFCVERRICLPHSHFKEESWLPHTCTILHSLMAAPDWK